MKNINTPLDYARGTHSDAMLHLLEADAWALVTRAGLFHARSSVVGAPEFCSTRIRFRSLLSILTMAYARGIYPSEEIEELCTKAPMWRAWCDGKPTSAGDLSRFRRAARPALRETLAQVLEDSIRAKRTMEDFFPQLAHTRGIETVDWRDSACWRTSLPARGEVHRSDPLNSAADLDYRAMAEERIQRAIFADCMSGDW